MNSKIILNDTWHIAFCSDMKAKNEYVPPDRKKNDISTNMKVTSPKMAVTLFFRNRKISKYKKDIVFNSKLIYLKANYVNFPVQNAISVTSIIFYADKYCLENCCDNLILNFHSEEQLMIVLNLLETYTQIAVTFVTPTGDVLCLDSETKNKIGE